jgi:hypothetical protein
MDVSLKRIGVLRAGVMAAVFYLCMGLFEIPFMTLVMMHTAKTAGEGAGAIIFFIFLIPLAAVFFGFLVGVISALLYNLVAKFIGGMEFEFEKLPEAPNPPVSIPPPIA